MPGKGVRQSQRQNQPADHNASLRTHPQSRRILRVQYALVLGVDIHVRHEQVGALVAHVRYFQRSGRVDLPRNGEIPILHVRRVVIRGDREASDALVVQTVDGKVLDLQQQKGKVVFINFWATWCPPCLAELPSVNDLYLKVKDNPNIVFLSIDADNKLPKSSLFLKNRGYLFPVYSGDLTLPPTFYSGNIPTTLVINKKGDEVFNHVDKANYADEEFAQYLIGLSKE